jgi:hypothetical protein
MTDAKTLAAEARTAAHDVATQHTSDKLGRLLNRIDALERLASQAPAANAEVERLTQQLATMTRYAQTVLADRDAMRLWREAQEVAHPVAAEVDGWYEKHQAECTKDYGEYDEEASLATRLRWWVPKSARHGRLMLEDDLLEAVEALAKRDAAPASVQQEVVKPGTAQWCAKCGEGVVPGLCRRKDVASQTSATASQPVGQGDGEAVAEPLVEPVTISKAMRAHREAKVWLDKGTGPVCCVGLVNIQIEPWNRHTPKEAQAFATGFNLAAKWMREALAARHPQEAAPTEGEGA